MVCVGVSGVRMCQWCQYVAVVSVCFSGVSMCQLCQYVSVVEIFLVKILELLVKNILVAPGLVCRNTGMSEYWNASK